MPVIKSPTQFDIGHGGTQTRAATAGRIVNHLVSSFTASDSYATVVGASIGSAAMSNTDWSFSGAAGASRVATVAAKSIALTAGFGGTITNVWSVLVDTVTSEWLLAWPVASVSPSGSLSPGGVVTRPSQVDTQTQPT